MSMNQSRNPAVGQMARLREDPLEEIGRSLPELGGVGLAGALEAYLQGIDESLKRLVSPDTGQSDGATANLTIDATAFAAIVAAITALGTNFQTLGNKKQLGQLRPADANPASLYTPATGKKGRVTMVNVANTSAAAATYRLFADDDGAVFDESTALFWDVELGAGKAHVICVDWGMDDSGGNIGVRSSVASALTFTAFGDKEI